MIEDGKKHVLILYNCKLDMTGEVSFQAANAKSAANLKVKGRLQDAKTLRYPPGKIFHIIHQQKQNIHRRSGYPKGISNSHHWLV